jgi:2-C-methyl-D-erythritol 2,4-cyclodiphosphate synthase
MTLSMRIGHGYDIHRLKSGGRLMLGGIEVSTEISPIAHSDGDVVLHALVDALLGAVAMGDIGQMFPNNDPKWKDTESRVFVEAALREVRRRGFSVVNADITIMAERPRLAPFRGKMVESISGIIGGQVNVKAGTNEGCDAIGRGEAIAAHVVVLLAGE